MSHAFTILPAIPIDSVVARVLSVVQLQPKIRVKREKNGAVLLYFAGHKDVIGESQQHQLRALTRVRIARAIHVDAEGYDASAEQLEVFVRWVVDEFGPCRVLDDETGEDLSRLEPRELFRAEPEFVD